MKHRIITQLVAYDAPDVGIEYAPYLAGHYADPDVRVAMNPPTPGRGPGGDGGGDGRGRGNERHEVVACVAGPRETILDIISTPEIRLGPTLDTASPAAIAGLDVRDPELDAALAADGFDPLEVRREATTETYADAPFGIQAQQYHALRAVERGRGAGCSCDEDKTGRGDECGPCRAILRGGHVAYNNRLHAAIF